MSYQGVEFTPEMREMVVVESGIEHLVRKFVRRANRGGDPVNIEIIRNFMRNELYCDIAHTNPMERLTRPI